MRIEITPLAPVEPVQTKKGPRYVMLCASGADALRAVWRDSVRPADLPKVGTAVVVDGYYQPSERGLPRLYVR